MNMLCLDFDLFYTRLFWGFPQGVEIHDMVSTGSVGLKSLVPFLSKNNNLRFELIQFDSPLSTGHFKDAYDIEFCFCLQLSRGCEYSGSMFTGKL